MLFIKNVSKKEGKKDTWKWQYNIFSRSVEDMYHYIFCKSFIIHLKKRKQNKLK